VDERARSFMDLTASNCGDNMAQTLCIPLIVHSRLTFTTNRM
jgi:hypothetical protein